MSDSEGRLHHHPVRGSGLLCNRGRLWDGPATFVIVNLSTLSTFVTINEIHYGITESISNYNIFATLLY